jgi:RimJ/RimL family protein N-acetyltransferase
MVEADLADYFVWATTDTEWGEWDAPWEEDVDPNEWTAMLREDCLNADDNPRYRFEIEDERGRHIGWVSRYGMDEDRTKIAVGIDIPPQDARGKGYGKAALEAFVAYLFREASVDAIYAQTWSGNAPMIALAESIGFKEIRRITDIREVRGGKYDALTFELRRS